MSLITRVTRHLGVIAFSCCAAQAQALEITAGDFEPLPAGMNLLLLYFQHAESSDFYQQGDKVSDRFKLKTDVSLLRYVHSFGLGENVVVEPQFILPYGHLHAGGDASALGQTTGTGDLFIGAPVKWTLSTTNKDIFSLAPAVYIPIGSYDRNDALNLGENRWRLLLQAAYIHHFNEQWAVDTAADATWFSHNNDYTSNSATLKQQTRYEYQAYLRYNLSAQTQFAVGGGRIEGGKTSVNGINLDDRTNTTYVRVMVNQMLTPSVQVQVEAGRDIEVEQGFKENARINLRLAKLF
ncbi:transporter [Pseudomonas fluorescens]|uniref:Transporter n=1 Tax=Pseudomonas fluorescens TaxID=294 RepID=A0A327N975_PSEFL|nr:transporter [Pseudomonas fluorescens]RAI70849.1 transporter [Pseudomonas fluorescens]